MGVECLLALRDSSFFDEDATRRVILADCCLLAEESACVWRTATILTTTATTPLRALQLTHKQNQIRRIKPVAPSSSPKLSSRDSRHTKVGEVGSEFPIKSSQFDPKSKILQRRFKLDEAFRKWTWFHFMSPKIPHTGSVEAEDSIKWQLDSIQASACSVPQGRIPPDCCCPFLIGLLAPLSFQLELIVVCVVSGCV